MEAIKYPIPAQSWALTSIAHESLVAGYKLTRDLVPTGFMRPLLRWKCPSLLNISRTVPLSRSIAVHLRRFMERAPGPLHEAGEMRERFSKTPPQVAFCFEYLSEIHQTLLCGIGGMTDTLFHVACLMVKPIPPDLQQRSESI